MLSDDVTQLQPEGVLGLALQRPEGVVVDTDRKLRCSFAPPLIFKQVCNIFLSMSGFHPVGGVCVEVMC